MSLNEDYYERKVPKFDPGEPPEHETDMTADMDFIGDFIENLSDEALDKLIEQEKRYIQMYEEEMIRRENERTQEHKSEA